MLLDDLVIFGKFLGGNLKGTLLCWADLLLRFQFCLKIRLWNASNCQQQRNEEKKRLMNMRIVELSNNKFYFFTISWSHQFYHLIGKILSWEGTYNLKHIMMKRLNRLISLMQCNVIEKGNFQLKTKRRLHMMNCARVVREREGIKVRKC